MKPKRPKAPKHLKKHGALLYRDIAAEFEITDSGGIALLTTACECLDRLRSAQAAVDEHGPLTMDRYGCLRANPALAIEKTARGHLLQALKQLNLDIEPIRNRVGSAGTRRDLGGTNHAN